jgi:hypothetical protein
MGNHRLYKTERLHVLGTPGSERLKVAALNLFHPTASPPFQKAVFHITTQSPRREGMKGRGNLKGLNLVHPHPPRRRGRECLQFWPY